MASDDVALTQQAVARWHELVRELDPADPGLERLREITIYGDRRVINVVRPLLMTAVRLEQERLAVSLIGSSLRKLIAALRTRPELLDVIEASPEERALAAIDPGFDDVDVFDRYDAFASKRLGFVEVQGGAPGGPGYHDAEARAFRETAIYARMADEYGLEPVLVLPHLLAALLDSYRAWGGDGDPTIAIVDWSDAPLMMEFEIVRDFFVANGHPTVICDPRELRAAGGRLHCGDTPIDLVYRRLVIQDVLSRPADTVALVDAMRAGSVCVVNPFAAALLGHKAVFDLLGAADTDLGLTPAERNAVHSHVPWTRKLGSPGATSNGTVVAPEEVVAGQDQLVLKPAHDYGGHGVHLGWETGADAWAKLVDEFAGEDWIVQRRVSSHHELFPRDEPGFPLHRFYLDTDPYTFAGRMGGLLTRLSAEGGITNVTQGGSLIPAFVVSP
jgi:hypothetical protein